MGRFWVHWVLLGLYGSFRVPIEVWEVLGAVGIVWGVPIGWGERKVVVLYHPKEVLPIRTLMGDITPQPHSRNRSYGKAWTCLEPS